MRRRLLVIAILLAFFTAVPAGAESQPKNKGLYLSPARTFITVDAGHTMQRQITVANYTDKTLVISSSVQQFTVADFSYNYQFRQADENWITIEPFEAALQPGKSQKLTYDVSIPVNAQPGGHYFSVIITGTSQDPSIKDRAQTASVIYITVGGTLQASYAIQKTSVPKVAFGDINFSLQVKNTGNTHFFIYVSGKANGMNIESKGPQTTALLMPQTVREVSSVIPAPLWPGIYGITYGFVGDYNQTKWQKENIIYLPIWFLLVVASLSALIFVFVRHFRRARGSLPQQYK